MILRGLFLLCLSVGLRQCADLKETAGNDVLHYLNSNSEQIYRYKNIKSLDILNQENDVYDIKTSIEVECLQDADNPCLTKSFNCEGKLQYRAQSSSFEVQSLYCNPNAVEELISEDEIVDTTTPEVYEETTIEDVTTETDIPEDTISPEHCTGCPVDLDKNVEGVSILLNTALKHLETERDNIQSAVEVVRLQRQIVSGVLYILVVKVAPTTCPKGTLEVTEQSCPVITEAPVEYCEVKYIQKPWISKDKSIISNNCTKSQEFTLTKDLSTNTIDTDDDRDKVKGSDDDIPPERIDDMESQIVPHSATAPEPYAKDEKPAGVNLPDSIKSFADSFFDNFDPILNVKESEIKSDVPTTEVAEEVKTTQVPKADSSEESDENESKSKESSEEDAQVVVSVVGKRELLRKDLKLDTSEESSGTSEEQHRRKQSTSEEISSSESPESSEEHYRERRSTSEEKSEESPESSEEHRNKRSTSEKKSEESSDEASESSEEHHRERRSTSEESSEETSESPESVNTSEEKDKNRNKRNNKSNSSSSSSSNSSDDDNDNNNNNNNDEKRKNGKQCKSRNGNDNTDSSSSDDSSSDDDDDDECKNDNNRRARSAELEDSREEILTRNLAEIAAAALDAKDGGSYRHVILDVKNREKTQLEGTVYHLKVKLGKSKCKRTDEDFTNRDLLKSHSSKQDEECAKKLKSHTLKVCDVQIHLTDEYTSPKLLKLDCGSRARRDILVGGNFNVSVDDSEVLELAHNTVALYDGTTSHDNKYKVVEVTWASKQIVAGTLHKFGLKIALSDCQKTDSKPSKDCDRLRDSEDEICEVKVWSQPWLPEGVRTSITCENKQAQHFRSKRSPQVGVPGGKFNVSLDDPTVVELAHNTVALYDGTSSHDNKYKVVEITWASSQIVSGTSHDFGLKIALSDCQKTDSKPSKDCDRLRGSEDEICEVNVWSQPWLPEGVKTSITCENKQEQHFSRSKRSPQIGAPGGKFNVSLDDPTVVELAHNTVALYDGTTSHDNKYKVVEVTWASSQTVSGTLHDFGLKIALSDCQKTDSTPSKDCNRLRGSEDEICEVSVLSQPWLAEGDETSIACENKDAQKFRSKRSTLVGGVETVSTDDETILNLVEQTLAKLDSESSLSEKYKATEILSASKQLVAGVLYTIEVSIAPSDCLKTDKTDRDQCNIGKEQSPTLCRVKIWDRPWLPDGRETNVTCNQATYAYRTRRSVARPLGRDDLDVQLSVFRDFKQKYNRIYYNRKEEIRRFRIFRKNLAKINELNANDQGTAVYGITKFADLTYSEFQKKHMGLRPDLHEENEIPHPQARIPDIELPAEFDWRTKGVVTEVKDQQQCGSCWAFSVTGNVEGQYAIKHEKLVSLSEQELVDCDKSDAGCEGGLMDNAYRAIEQIGGLETETDYPYDAEDESCHYNNSAFRVKLSGAVNISQNEDDMAKWLVANGPISIAINANAMQFYVGGVSHPFKFLCSPDDLDHGVLIVGYGVHTYPLFKKTLPFWIVKNSWGKSWGEQGYYRVYKGDGTCGLNKTPSSAVVV